MPFTVLLAGDISDEYFEVQKYKLPSNALSTSLQPTLIELSAMSNIYIDRHLEWIRDVILDFVKVDGNVITNLEFEYVFAEARVYTRAFVFGAGILFRDWQLATAAIFDILLKFYGEVFDSAIPWSEFSHNTFNGDEFLDCQLAVLEYFKFAIPRLVQFA